MSKSLSKVSKNEAKAGTALNEAILVTFKGTDGKQYTVKDLASQAVTADDKRMSIAENLFIVAKGMKAEEFASFDKDVRAAMKWGKAPTKATVAEKAVYRGAPSTWKNAASIIGQSFKHGVDIAHYDGVYSDKGINNELKARKDALGANNTTRSEGSKAIAELSPEIQAMIMRLTALDAVVKEQPDAASMLVLVMEELTQAVQNIEVLLDAGIPYVGSELPARDLDAELTAAMAAQ